MSDEVDDADVVWQIIFEQQPAWHLEQPDGPPIAAWRLRNAQLAEQEQWASGGVVGTGPFRTMRRSLHLTVRLEPHRSTQLRGALSSARAELVAQERFDRDTARLLLVAERIEGRLRIDGLQMKACSPDELLRLLQQVWRDPERVRDHDPAYRRPYNPTVRLGDQIVHDEVHLHPHAAQVGSACTEIVTWLEQPSSVDACVLRSLLYIQAPLRAIWVIRPSVPTSDLPLRALQFRVPSLDARTRRQATEHRALTERLAGGERIVGCTLAILVQSEAAPGELARRGQAQSVRRVLGQAGLDTVVERSVAPAFFTVLGPLATSTGALELLGRERRVLGPGPLSAYLPLW
ncbi:MAG: hypothetical protein AAFP22_23690, partial [Planctomycetota bacterium]